MICIECHRPVEKLYGKLKKGHIKTEKCVACGNTIDKYVEFDLVILSVDLLLFHSQAYAHLIHNYVVDNDFYLCKDGRPRHFKVGYAVTQYGKIMRTCLLFLLFEIYLNWAYEEKTNFEESFVLSLSSVFQQYGFFFAKTLLEFLITFSLIQWCLLRYLHLPAYQTIAFESNGEKRIYVYPASHTRMLIIAAISFSNIIRLFPIIMLIWPYEMVVLKLTNHVTRVLSLVILAECLNTIIFSKKGEKSYWKATMVVLFSKSVAHLTTKFIFHLKV